MTSPAARGTDLPFALTLIPCAPPVADDQSHLDKGATLSKLELRCPPLPHTLTEALELMHTPERMEVKPVTEMVERDPAVVARLLQTVNSAYYGLQRSISSTKRAVVMLGPVAVTGLVVGMNMLKLRSIVDGPAKGCFLRLIQHNIAAAHLARYLTEHVPARPPRLTEGAGDAFTAGLLHDFGKIILVYNFAEEAVALYEDQSLETQVQDPDLCQMEQLLFGYDHTEAGEFAARKLNFPEMLIDVMRRHHDPAGLERPDALGRLLRAVVAANEAAKAMGYAFIEPRSWDDALEHPVWAHLLEHDLPEIDDLAALRDALCAQQSALDTYVAHLSPTVDADASSTPSQLHTSHLL